MKLKEMSLEELESMSYTDIAYKILLENKKKLTLAELFKKICTLLKLSDAEYEAGIVDFFQSLATDQRFIMLEKGNWDLKSRHQSKMVIASDEEEEDEVEEEDTDSEEDLEEDTGIYDDEDSDDDTDDDDYKDLVIVDEDSDEENASI